VRGAAARTPLRLGRAVQGCSSGRGALGARLVEEKILGALSGGIFGELMMPSHTHNILLSLSFNVVKEVHYIFFSHHIGQEPFSKITCEAILF